MISGETRSSLVYRSIRPGKAGFARRIVRFALRSWFRLRTRSARVYQAPNEEDLRQIEAEIGEIGMVCDNLQLDPAEFKAFVECFHFPADYYGSPNDAVRTEKLLEHFVAWKLLALDRPDAYPYVDIAACSSPWVKLLRTINAADAYATDLEVASAYSDLPYYRQEDATHSAFPAGSIARASLQCAFEMFVGDDDRDLVVELARILAPGGRAVISPLYTHTHPCFYQTPEFFGTSSGDTEATAYIRRDIWGVRASRKYSPKTLRTRVWDVALASGLKPSLLVLRNGSEFGSGVYLHFVLALDKPEDVAP